MKKLLAMISLTVLTLNFTSCSSSQVNSYKIKVADSTKAAVVKELNEAYMSVQVEGIDCAAEAEELGEKVREKLIDLLDADLEAPAQKSMSKGLASSLVGQVCGLAIGTLTDYLSASNQKYTCLVMVGADKIEDVGSDLCTAIDF